MKINFPFLQIAGFLSEEEVLMVSKFSNIYLGFPLVLDYHTEDLPKEIVKGIINRNFLNDKSVLITYLNIANEISKILNYLHIKIVQIHSDINLDELIKTKEQDFTIIKSLIIKDNNLNELLLQIDNQQDYVDAFITDTYDESTGAKGATGKTHNWEISRKIVKYSKKPVIIAGGLNSENVKEAILHIKPAGVDAHTGIEDDSGIKSKEKIKKFYDISMKYLNLR